MKHSERERLAKQIAQLERNERQHLYKRAGKLRKESKKKGGNAKQSRRRDWSDEAERSKPEARRTSHDSLKDWAIRILAADEAALAAEKEHRDGLEAGTVLAVMPGECEVALDRGQRVRCSLNPDLRRRQQTALAVGDRVAVRSVSDAHVVAHVQERRSALTRIDPGNEHREKVIVANVDIVVIVATAGHPPLLPGMIDRYLLAIERGGARAVVCANKLDLCDEKTRETELARLAAYEERGVPVFACSATQGEGVQALLRTIEASVCAFVGKSGAGKSSLVNALLDMAGSADQEEDDVNARVFAVRDGDGKGRHTTTRAELYTLHGGTQIIDTPGIRALGLRAVGAEDLDTMFPQIAGLAKDCHYRDCTHSHEPSCRVKRAIQDGELEPARWKRYRRMLE